MHAPFRILCSAALIAALGPTQAAYAENGGGPGFAFDTADDFSTLRGTDPGSPVEIGAQPTLDAADAALVDGTLNESPGGKPLRVQAAAPVATEDEDAPAKKARTADARDETAYDPLGIRLGSFILLPAVELRGGYTSNAAGASSGGPSGLLAIAPDILLKSDWSRNEATFRLKGVYDYYTDTSVAPYPNLYVEGNGRIDLPNDWALRLKADYNYDTQSLSSLDYPAGVDNPPGVNTYDAGVTLEGDVGRIVLQLRGTGTYTGYDDGLAGDIVINQSYRNNTLLSGAARIGYQWTPAVAPFVEAQLSTRLFTQPTDIFGYSRDSNGLTIRGGIAYSADPILRGEIALGWHREAYVDETFNDFDAPTIDASLVWSPSQLTEIAFVASTTLDPANDPGASSKLVYDLGLTATRYIRRNFTLEGDLGYQYERYIGTDLADITYEAGIQATYKFNREAWLVGRLSQEYYQSALPGGDYPTTTATIGLRLQR